MKRSRKEWISLLLCLYALLTAAAAVTLPQRIKEERTKPADATVTAPLALPEELQERLENDAESTVPKPEEPPQPAIPDPPEEPPQTEEPAIPEEEPEKEPDTARIVTKKPGALVNVRKKASLDAKITASVYGGDTVTILSVKGNWYKIQKDDIIGYVYGDYLGEPEAPAP